MRLPIMLAVSVVLLAVLAGTRADSSYLPFLDSEELESFLPGLSGRTAVNKLIDVTQSCNAQVEQMEAAYTRAELDLLDQAEQAEDRPEEMDRLEAAMLETMEAKNRLIQQELEACMKVEDSYLKGLSTNAVQFFTALLVDFERAGQFRQLVKQYRAQVSVGLELCMEDYEKQRGDLPPEVFQSEKMCRESEVKLFLSALDDFIAQMDDIYFEARAALYRGILPVQLTATDSGVIETAPTESDVHFFPDSPDNEEDLVGTDNDIVAMETVPLPTTEPPTGDEEVVLTGSIVVPTAAPTPGSEKGTGFEAFSDEELETLLTVDGLDDSTMEAIFDELYNREILHRRGSPPMPRETEESTSATEATSPVSQANSQATSVEEDTTTSRGTAEVVTIETVTTPPLEVATPSQDTQSSHHRHDSEREHHRRPDHRHDDSTSGRPRPHHHDDGHLASTNVDPLKQEDDPRSEKHHIAPVIAFTVLGFFCFAIIAAVVVVLVVVFRCRRGGFAKTCRGNMLNDKQRLGLLRKAGYVNPTYRFHELQDKGEEF